MDIKGASRDLKRIFLKFFCVNNFVWRAGLQPALHRFLGPDLDLQFEFRV